ncbi:MAG: YitT family protein [Clostridia bacterium]|nr:YitT family protein [Clostridia bacterium]
MRSKFKKSFIDIFTFILGGTLVAVSVSCFTAPNSIAVGGLTGAATILFSLFSIPIGTTVLLLNIPIFIVGAHKLGAKFLYKTIIATVIMSALIDVFAVFMPTYTGDTLLASVYGGVLSGVGLALVFTRGATTGGVDIIAKLVNIKLPHFSMGKILLMLDAIVVIAAALVYQNLESALYAVIAIFAQSRVIDSIIYGADKGKVLLINSKKYELIAREILNKMQRGVTILNGVGAYTNQPSKIIMCAVRTHQAAQVHRIISDIDKTAFVVTFEAGEILGEGFRKI